MRKAGFVAGKEDAEMDGAEKRDQTCAEADERQRKTSLREKLRDNRGSSDIGTVAIAVALLLVVGFLGSSCMDTCSSSKHSSHVTEKERETAMWLGEHGYFDD